MKNEAPVAESCTKADRPLDPPEKDIHASNACRCLSSAGMVQTALDIMRRDGNWTEMAALIECCKDLIPIEVLDVNLQWYCDICH